MVTMQSPCESCDGAGTMICASCEPQADEDMNDTIAQHMQVHVSGHRGDEFAEARDMMRRLRKQPVCTLETKRDRVRKLTNVKHMQERVRVMGGSQ